MAINAINLLYLHSVHGGNRYEKLFRRKAFLPSIILLFLLNSLEQPTSNALVTISIPGNII